MRRWWPLGLYRVAGDSMQPTYPAGATLLGSSWLKPRAGRIVVARHGGRLLIKRVLRLEPAGLWLQGDNTAASTDSRQFGHVPLAAVEAVIIARLG